MLDRFRTKSPKVETKAAAKGQKSGKGSIVSKAQSRMQGQVQGRRKIAERMQEFFRNTQSEVKKVTWPTRQQTINLTIVVIGLSLAVGVSLGVIDLALSALIRLVSAAG
jgi:preprotein translocase subunit SecE